MLHDEEETSVVDIGCNELEKCAINMPSSVA
jgi:hypothetical protein